MDSTPEVGDPYSWTPACFINHLPEEAARLGATVRVNGRVIYVNRAHGWFRAEATYAGGTIRECFRL